MYRARSRGPAEAAAASSRSVASMLLRCVFFFFFQAEDGIRDGRVTGVQTCALPISLDLGAIEVEIVPVPGHSAGHVGIVHRESATAIVMDAVLERGLYTVDGLIVGPRSEERRVGKECRSRGSAYD